MRASTLWRWQQQHGRRAPARRQRPPWALRGGSAPSRCQLQGRAYNNLDMGDRKGGVAESASGTASQAILANTRPCGPAHAWHGRGQGGAKGGPACVTAGHSQRNGSRRGATFHLVGRCYARTPVVGSKLASPDQSREFLTTWRITHLARNRRVLYIIRAHSKRKYVIKCKSAVSWKREPACALRSPWAVLCCGARRRPACAWLSPSR